MKADKWIWPVVLSSHGALTRTTIFHLAIGRARANHIMESCVGARLGVEFGAMQSPRTELENAIGRWR